MRWDRVAEKWVCQGEREIEASRGRELFFLLCRRLEALADAERVSPR